MGYVRRAVHAGHLRPQGRHTREAEAAGVAHTGGRGRMDSVSRGQGSRGRAQWQQGAARGGRKGGAWSAGESYNLKKYMKKLHEIICPLWLTSDLGNLKNDFKIPNPRHHTINDLLTYIPCIHHK